jgi:hypothetical protein
MPASLTGLLIYMGASILIKTREEGTSEKLQIVSTKALKG